MTVEVNPKLLHTEQKFIGRGKEAIELEMNLRQNYLRQFPKRQTVKLSGNFRDFQRQ